MISGTHTVDIEASPERLWTFLSSFDNWAKYVVGFQKFVVVDERTSVWTLRGDVGVLAREVDLEVKLLEEVPGRRATYSITGITERIDGTGTFEIAARGSRADDASAVGAPAAPAVRPATGWWGRLLRRWALVTLRRRHSKDEKPRASRAAAPDFSDAPAGGARDEDQISSILTFTLEVTPGGPMAPVVEILMRPLVEPAAEDFSTRIRAHIEGTAHV
jgi:carbon monoxide dehydrogenase subunit G